MASSCFIYNANDPCRAEQFGIIAVYSKDKYTLKGLSSRIGDLVAGKKILQPALQPS
jgi:hypothetical protein